MLKIIITGPESSGKTTLCKDLAIYFKVPFTEEYAREYLTNLNKKYKQKDLLIIAKQQLKNEQINIQHKIILLDTDLITIKIWSNYKFKRCDKWISKNIQKQTKEDRLYVLCKPDIDWEKDPLRENPNTRKKIFKLYEEELIKLKHNYFIIQGRARLSFAISEIEKRI